MMVSRHFWNGRLPVWIASLTLLALASCAMPLLEETVDEAASEELPEDTQLQTDETTNESPNLEDPLDPVIEPGEPPPDGPRTRDPRRGDDTRIPEPPADDAEDPPVDDVEEPPADDDCLSLDAECCRRVTLVRRLEQRGYRFADEGRRGGGLIRSTVAEAPDCFVGFVFADNMTCSLETGTCEPIDEQG